MKFRSSRPHAFTLVELLTVIAVISVLAAILISVLGSVRKSANQAKCVSNMRAITQGILMYASEHGRYPRNADGMVYDIAIMPYLDVENSAIRNLPIRPVLRSDPAGGAVSGIAELFRSPADEVVRTNPDAFPRSYALVPWAFNWSNGSVTRGFPNLDRNTGVPPVVVQNPSKAALLVQVHRPANVIGALSNATSDGPASTADTSIHGKQSNVAFADGHVTSINYTEFTPGEFIAEYWGGAGISQN